ncbi:MAG: hypothetical protein KDA59_17095 [Planctomycetales bacterium]|nr:hypothetical protein [Planctomycetales bacterium]MCA9220383.1 hypothetical protein [Planctomycetales bacterium]
MSDPRTTQLAREQAAKLLAQHGAPDSEPFYETIMIRDGGYIGRRFSRGHLSALWTATDNEIRVIDEEHHELGHVHVDAPQLPRAA